MGRPKRNGKDSPIDSKQKALAEQEENLRRKMQDLQRMIDDAPRRAEEAEKVRRQDMSIRASQSSRRAESPNSLIVRRVEVSGALPRTGKKRLRAERQAARLKFAVLCIIFAVCILLLFAKFK
jgi:type II secretory pathway component PulJ